MVAQASMSRKRLTGRIRPRSSRFGKRLIIQVEVEIGHGLYPYPGEEFKVRYKEFLWRDATADDLMISRVYEVAVTSDGG